MRVLLVLLLWVGSLSAESKIALLIGNEDYSQKRLDNPINDVNLLETKLKEIGFTVYNKQNLSKSQMINELRNFYKKVNSDTIALIYFSGHGVNSTLDRKNYLIPIGAFSSLFNEGQLSDLAISDNYLLNSTAGAKFSILLLDACRSNDFKKVRGTKGLGQPNSNLQNDYVISYATEVGKTAEDGTNNSPYALALNKYLNSTYSLADMFTLVRSEVSKITKGKQEPLYDPHFKEILYLNKVSFSQSNSLIVPSNKEIIVIKELMYQNQLFTMQDKNNYDDNKNGSRVWSWKYAKKYCQDLTLNGFKDWRLPTESELKKLKTNKKAKSLQGYEYYIKKEFINKMPSLSGKYHSVSFWSISEWNNKIAFSMRIDQEDTDNFWVSKNSKNYTLCIRNP